jgi:anti-sigma regulatory factor (Ser/Thr protein kinase)
MAVSSVSLPVSVTAPALARRAVVEQVGPTFPAQRMHDAELLITEVVTNAVRHAGLHEGDLIDISLRDEHGSVVVEVADPGSGFAALPRPTGDPLETGGWGMLLLDRLSDGWGLRDRPGGGSVVWFRVDPR